MKKANGKDKRKPETKREWALYRAKLSCGVGKESIDGNNGDLSMAIFSLLNAIEDLAIAMEEKE